MFIIIIIIFIWPVTSLIHPYDFQTIARDEDTGAGGFNPWFTKGHYVMADEITKWELVKKSIDDTFEDRNATDEEYAAAFD